MLRADMSDDLVHWTKGQSDQEAFDALSKIVSEHRLLGGNSCIKGEFTCVCFSEAPLSYFYEVRGRYRPFGILLSKRWVFLQGGRPVIYQAPEEFERLPMSHRWR